jgi:hypothetical protein
MQWHLHVMNHEKQKDTSSCGPLVARFLTHTDECGILTGITSTSKDAVTLIRQNIYQVLLDCTGLYLQLHLLVMNI